MHPAKQITFIPHENPSVAAGFVTATAYINIIRHALGNSVYDKLLHVYRLTRLS